MGFDITILGSAGSHCGAGRACSGYLLEADDVKVMVDCGNGSTSNLQRYHRFEDLDAVVISHRHVDHCIDLVGMYYGLKFHEEGQKTIPLYAGPEVVDLLTSMLSRDSALEFRDTFLHTPVSAGDTFEIGPLTFDLYPSVHPVPTVSMRITYEDKVVAYSSDSFGGPDLIDAAQGADYFLCEATWLGRMEDWPEGIHLTASEAGRVATQAEVGHLILTHILPSQDREQSLVECREEWAGKLSLADDNQHWKIA